MKRVLNHSLALALATGILAVAGCGETLPTRFYVLSYDFGSMAGEPSTIAREGIGVGVGPVELPQYLDRPHIVTRSSGNKLELAEFDQWGGRLKDNFTRVLAENLSVELSTDRISIYPWKGTAPVDYQVTVQVTAFEVTPGGQTLLDTRWSIVGQDTKQVLTMARSSYRQDLDSGGEEDAAAVSYEAVAAAMSRNISDLGRDIAAKIKALSGQ